MDARTLQTNEYFVLAPFQDEVYFRTWEMPRLEKGHCSPYISDSMQMTFEWREAASWLLPQECRPPWSVSL